ncbi:PREDICTED: gibberellin-regulated protein 6-like [Nelumbo nucifera]|uniref:Gibberellin-regulated protein 6-like n=2 Tax=Nelumbo nucifera TaxID=4432 RepID=A0A1U7ZJR2_NELNU|nr:PREDICTED: gibberellin-regulated protein 6-like [Nelumbo nucifera]DAD47072.1 TPA_asm: hypothetical protein HUJ06_017009 [Nelumbo nucifera]
MGKSFHVFILLLCFAALTSSTQVWVEKQLEQSLVTVGNQQHKHRHSGFSQAECPGACTYRCSQTAYKKPCMFFCQKCCFKCRCVPPGTYGHKEVCPCYNNWKTKRGGPKCP